DDMNVNQCNKALSDNNLNNLIKTFIKKTQHCKHKLEIIPYNQVTDITYIAKGGFRKRIG
ncbi:5210_t:CDS:1, partial [Gigaspora rosea]